MIPAPDMKNKKILTCKLIYEKAKGKIKQKKTYISRQSLVRSFKHTTNILVFNL